MSSRDSYRPHNTRARSRSRSPPRSFTGNSDSRYRDRGFDFEHNRQLPERTREADRYREERDRGDSYRPRAGRGGRGGGRGGARGGAGGMGGAAPYWKKPPPPPAHDRPILNHSFREKTPELMPGMITGGFEVHAAEEEGGEEGGDAPMDLSDQEEEVVVVHAKSSEPAAAATKVPEEVATTEDAEHVAGITTTAATTTLKLPNGEEKKLEGKEGKEIVEVEKKKVDVIAMIRAAKAKAAKEEVRKDEVAAGDDFISFGSMALDDKPEKQKSEESDYDEHRKMRKLNDSTKAPLEAPRGPADPSKPFSFKEQLHGPYIPSVDEGPPGVGPLSRNAKLPPPPGPGRDTRKALGKRRRGHDDYSDSQDDYDQSLDYEDAHDHPDVPQNRKRKHDEISRGNNKIDGNIKWELRPKPGINHMPWMTAVTDHSKTLKLSVWYV